MADITDAQVISLLQNMAFERRAFARAEEIMQAVTNAKKLLDGLEAQKAAKEKEIKQEEEGLKAAVEQKRAAELEADRAKQETEIKKAQLGKEISELAQAKVKAQADFDEFKAKAEADRAQLERMVKAKAGELEQASKDLKRKLNAEWEEMDKTTKQKTDELAALQKAFDQFKVEHRL
jgi:hypothetical protein